MVARPGGVTGLLARAKENVTTGAFTLGAPGISWSERDGRLVVGHRPGVFLKVAMVGLTLLALGAAALLWPVSPWLAFGFAFVFTAPPALALLNHQRYELERGMVRARGRALGRTWDRDLPLGRDAAVDIAPRPERDADSGITHTAFVVRVRSTNGWVPIAESMDLGQARAFAERVAAATGAGLATPVQA